MHDDFTPGMADATIIISASIDGPSDMPEHYRFTLPPTDAAAERAPRKCRDVIRILATAYVS